MNLFDYVPTAQAAAILGYSDSKTLSSYCIQKKIPGAQKIGGRWYIPRSWLSEELKSPSLAPQGGRGKSRK